MEVLNNIVKHYNEFNNSSNNSNENIELEISFHLLKNKDIYTNIFNKLKSISSSIVIHEYINIYYDNNIRLTKQFKNGVNMNKDIYLQKNSLSKTYNNFYNKKQKINPIQKYNIKLKKETILTENDFKKLKLTDIKLVNIKLRLSFLFEKYNFRIDLDLVNNVNLKQNNLKDIKNRIFKSYKLSNITEELNYNLFDNLILETEFLNENFYPIDGNSKLENDDIQNAIIFVESLFGSQNTSNNLNYQQYIYIIAQFIITNKFYLDSFREKSGLKKLLNNVIEMNSEIYSKNIQPQITSYYITDKIDGQRCIILYNQENDLINIKLVTNKIYQISEYNDDINNNNFTILDSEFILSDSLKEKDIISKNDCNLYLFDIIALNNNSTSQIPFEKRLLLIEQGFNQIKNLLNVKCKEFIQLTDNYKQELTNFYNKTRNYHIDGLIFTPSSNVLNSNYKYKINSNYNNMIGYKWKPIEEVTIDFYIKKLPKNLYSNIPYNSLNIKTDDIIYILFSGISKQDFDKLNMTYLINYNKIIPDEFHNNTYFPIQFSTSDNPINYIFISKEDNLDNLIGEFNYTDNKWTLKKIRSDRTVELNRGEYFGNYYKISELIWNNIKNPLTFDMLLQDNTNYFLIDDNQMYKSLRSYNSFVKSYLLETIINTKLSDKNNTDWIIDLASGKGQDLNRINNLGFHNGLFLDNDKNALLELINRKYTLRSQQQKNMKIFTQEINLTTNYKDIITKINKFNIMKETVDVIICNFAIHYIISNDNNIINLIKLLNHYLKPNGRFIFTCFNGEKVFKLLDKSNEWNLYEKNHLKYSIKKLYASNSFNNTGQKIDVLLPFSKHTYYTEYLINIPYITSMFNDNGFITEISDSFSCLLNNFKDNKIYNSLSNQDKEFIDLYQYTIIKKNYNNDIIIKSNIKEFFKCSQQSIAIGNNENNLNTSNYLSLDQLNNVNNSNSILLIINTIDSSILDYIIDKFENMNYKNKNKFKRNKNKIIKILAFDNNNFWLNIYKQFQLTNSIKYDSIIFYDITFKLTELFESYIIKKPIIPIVLNNINPILIINSQDLDFFITNLNNNSNFNSIIKNIKFISNTNINLNTIHNTYFYVYNLNFDMITNKSYDIYNTN